LFVNNILKNFYKYIFIVSQTINTNIYLEFRVFDTIFNYLKYLKKKKKKKKKIFRKILYLRFAINFRQSLQNTIREQKN